jgi:hypothetical protein
MKKENAMLFNVLPFLSDKLLTEGNTVAMLDESYIWLRKESASWNEQRERFLERLDALRFFMKSKEHATPQKELQQTLESLYEKYVPVETQEYLDSKRKPTPVRLRPKRSANATTPMATTIKEENGNG